MSEDAINIPLKQITGGFESIGALRIEGICYKIRGWTRYQRGTPMFGKGTIAGEYAYLIKIKDTPKALEIEADDWVGVGDGLYRITTLEFETFKEHQLDLMYSL